MEQKMEKPSVLICGYGIVGHHLKGLFPWADIYDKNLSGYDKPPEKIYDFAFVAVPTPKKEDGSCDTSMVEEVIKKITAEIYVIKSTVPPFTTMSLQQTYGKRIVFSPEYNGATQHANVEYGFTILGGHSSDTFEVVQLYQYSVNGKWKFYQTDSKTAELVKYMENSFLATKVVFVNEFYRLAKRLGVNYGVLRELFLQDPRVNPSHTYVYEKYPYYDSKCFNKDIPAIIKFAEELNMEMELMKSVEKINEKFKTIALKK